MTALQRQKIENFHKLVGLVSLALDEIVTFRIEHEAGQSEEKINALASYLKVEFVEKEGYRKMTCRRKKK